MKKLALLALTILVSTGCQVTKSPTGRTQALMYSNADMGKLGAQSFEEMKKQQKQVTHQPTIDYVQCVADAVTAKVDKKYGDTRWEVVVFDAPGQINAFALPGGHIGVYTGLLEVANTQDQLASVLGHEVGHVLAAHANERLSRSQLTNMGLTLASGAFDLAQVENKQLWMQGLGLGAQFGIALPFNRRQESESDEVGLDLMAKAGFNPNASVTLWQAMGEASGGKSQPEFLSTHPSNDTRIADLRQNMPQAELLYKTARQSGEKPNCKK